MNYEIGYADGYCKGHQDGYNEGKEDAKMGKIIGYACETKVNELFGRFIVAFEFMDADWRRCVLQFLTAMDDRLSKEEKR